jgi:nucleoside-diphosphate-sugar epimerase
MTILLKTRLFQRSNNIRLFSYLLILVFLVISALLEACNRRHVKRMVYLSSIYLQCSTWWPNVGGREAEYINYQKEAPFSAYCRSKNAAEQMILQCGMFFNPAMF